MEHPKDAAQPTTEAAIRTMLEQSRRDISEGRTVLLGPVLDRMRVVAKDIRDERT